MLPLTGEEYDRLHEICRELRTSQSALIRAAVLEALADNPWRRAEAKLDRIIRLLERR